ITAFFRRTFFAVKLRDIQEGTYEHLHLQSPFAQLYLEEVGHHARSPPLSLRSLISLLSSIFLRLIRLVRVLIVALLFDGFALQRQCLNRLFLPLLRRVV